APPRSPEGATPRRVLNSPRTRHHDGNNAETTTPTPPPGAVRCQRAETKPPGLARPGLDSAPNVTHALTPDLTAPKRPAILRSPVRAHPVPDQAVPPMDSADAGCAVLNK